MSDTPRKWSRATLSDALLRFAAERAMQTREFDRRVADLPADTPGQASLRAALGAAKAWEAAVLWVAWRLRPRTSIDT